MLLAESKRLGASSDFTDEYVLLVKTEAASVSGGVFVSLNIEH